MFRLEMSHSQMSEALDEASIIVVTDALGKIIYANSKFCEISGYTPQELVGKTHRLVNSGHHPKEFFEQMWSTIARGDTWKGEIKNQAKDGSFYWVETTIVPIYGKGEKPEKYLSLRVDITYKKESQELIDRERARAIYNSRMASLGEMAAGIAHELGNPLVALRGRLELINDQINGPSINPDDLQLKLQKMIGIIDRMSKIIRGISSYAREGSKDPFAQASINELVLDIIEFSTEKLRREGIEVIKEGFEEEISLSCRVSEIGQVFLNLFSNSCDAIRGQEKPWIRVKIEQNDSDVLLIVEDSGEGIAPELVEKIFQPFFTTKAVGKGTGIGLDMSKKIVEAHGGKITVDQQSPNTKFIIELPKNH